MQPRDTAAAGNAEALDLPQLEPAVFPPGMVWLIGAGPGDPSLLTLQGAQALALADTIVHDSLIDQRLLDWRRQSAEIVFAGKRGGRPSPKQEDISVRLVQLSRQGRRVARLKGGDPFVFGRGGEEALALVRAEVPIRVTPGVTAGIGGLSYAGIPLTHRDTNQSVTFITGHDHTGTAPGAVDWHSLARGSQVIVIYMALKNLAWIAAALMQGGRSGAEPVAVVFNASLPGQKVLETSLENAARDITEIGLPGPAVICVGGNVYLRLAIDWYAALKGCGPRRRQSPLAPEAVNSWGGVW